MFISKIGGVLASGERHDGRAPDYDDWELNGDILVYYPVLDIGLELSSMGIRVDEDSLKAQLKKPDVKIVQNFHSRRHCSTASFHIQSAAVSDSPVSVCIT